MKRKYIFLILLFVVGLVWSGINPKDYFTWILEVAPAIIGLLVLIATYKRFKLTDFTYYFILIHCWILFIGGHYTYTEVPFFDWLKETFDLSRNNYDKVGHFAQGFIPAIIVREIFVRQKVVEQKAWLNFIIVAVCLSFSAVYEFIEWWVAALTSEAADDFLGTQGYIWDTQSDMLYATIGAITFLLFLSNTHQHQIDKILGNTKA